MDTRQTKKNPELPELHVPSKLNFGDLTEIFPYFSRINFCDCEAIVLLAGDFTLRFPDAIYRSRFIGIATYGFR